MTEPPRVELHDLGRLAYDAAWAIQKERVARLKAEPEAPDALLLVEHHPVITLGRRAAGENVISAPEVLDQAGIFLRHVERGGDVTYHGPGQLVAYPILNLRRHRKDVRWYSQSLMSVAVNTLAAWGLDAEARDGPETGVWLPGGKIAAVGIRVERWIAYHGIALNVNPDLSHYAHIVPCGLTGRSVTSMAQVLGDAPDLAAVKAAFLRNFGQVFGVELQTGESVTPVRTGRR